MEIIIIIKHIFLATSVATLILSLIFMFLPRLYLRIEEVLSISLIPEGAWFTVLEGKINFLNDWIHKNRIIFGTIFVLLSIYNIKSILLL